MDARKGMFCASTGLLAGFAKMLSECPFFSECPSSLVRRRFPAQPSVAAASDWECRRGGAVASVRWCVGGGAGGVLLAGVSFKNKKENI